MKDAAEYVESWWVENRTDATSNHVFRKVFECLRRDAENILSKVRKYPLELEEGNPGTPFRLVFKSGDEVRRTIRKMEELLDFTPRAIPTAHKTLGKSLVFPVGDNQYIAQLLHDEDNHPIKNRDYPRVLRIAINSQEGEQICHVPTQLLIDYFGSLVRKRRQEQLTHTKPEDILGL